MSQSIEERAIACARAVEKGEGLQAALGVSDAYIAKVQDKAHELYRIGRNDDAEVLCRGLIALAPKRFYAHLLLSDVLRRQGELVESMQMIRTAAELAPENDVVRLKFAQALMASGEYDAARSELQKIAPDNELSAQADLLASRCAPMGVAS